MMRFPALPLKLTPQQRLAVAAAASGAVVVALVALLYIPLWGYVRQQWHELRLLRVKIEDAKLFSQQMAQEEAALIQAKQRYDAFNRRLGQGQSLARVLELLGQQAKALHLEFAAVQSRADEEANQAQRLTPELTVREIPLTVQLTGRFRQLGDFLGQLPQAPYMATIKSLRIIRPMSDSPKIQADIVLSVYLSV